MPDVEIPVELWSPLVHPIFARCVDPETTRFALGRPWVRGDHLYASDGRIMVRMPKPGAWDLPNGEKVLRDPGSVMDRGPHSAVPVTIPPVEGVCDECQGARVVTERACEECGGRGHKDVDYYCECPHCTGSHECEECEGEGTRASGPCRECRGSGVARGLSPHRIGPACWIGRAYAALLIEHGAEVFVPDPPDFKVPVAFRIGDIEGRLMGVTGPGDDA
jgi:hypothetical protein